MSKFNSVPPRDSGDQNGILLRQLLVTILKGTCDKMSKSSNYRQKLWLKSDFVDSMFWIFLKVISVPSSLKSLFPYFSMDPRLGSLRWLFLPATHVPWGGSWRVWQIRCYMWCFQNVTQKKLTCPMKNSGWKTTFLLKWPLFRGHVSFRGWIKVYKLVIRRGWWLYLVTRYDLKLLFALPKLLLNRGPSERSKWTYKCAKKVYLKARRPMENL